MPFSDLKQRVLTLGVNLRGLTGSVNMRPGEAQDSLDMLPRDDGAVYRSPGWERVNNTALSGVPRAQAGFYYKGKNNDTGGGDTARGGNFGLADDGADFTRRSDLFSGKILLTSTTAYRWEATAGYGALQTVSLPGGVSILADSKPVIKVAKNNLYIVGWTDRNLRYDPTDEAFYPWGWENVPGAPTVASVSVGGNLIGSATYKYAYTFLDIYTGEESALGASVEATTTAANKTVNLTFTAYAGTRHFNALAVATDTDVGIVVYRTEADQEAFHLLAVLNPGTLSYADDGSVSTTKDTEPFELQNPTDEPLFSALEDYRGRFYAFGPVTGRLYFSDLLFYERWRPLGHKDLPIVEGEIPLAIGRTAVSLIAHTNTGGFRNSVSETGAPSPQITPDRLPWRAGAVGPAARYSLDGWEYWLSEIGPMRWREALGAPQWIGRPISPMFKDATSGLCKLTEHARHLSEIALDTDTETLRWLFPLGSSDVLNQHWAYWLHAEGLNGDPLSGWFPLSPRAQCMDRSNAFTKLTEEGKPASATDRGERLCFADDLGYMNEYDIWMRRGGLKGGTLAKGFVRSGSTTATINVDGGLFTVGDGLRGMRFELIYADGTRIAGTILSNTDNTIVPVDTLDTAPADGDVFYVAGIPAFWRSWVDNFGEPFDHKKVKHINFGIQRGASEAPASELLDWRFDIRVGYGDFPKSFSQTRFKKLSISRGRTIVNKTARDFTYEIANTRPDENLVLTFIGREVMAVAQKRRV